MYLLRKLQTTLTDWSHSITDLFYFIQNVVQVVPDFYSFSISNQKVWWYSLVK